MRIAWWVVGAALSVGCSDGTGASGCPANLPASCPADAATYRSTIAPLVAASCGPCHSPGGTSVHYLTTHAEISALRGPVLNQVYACRMPPAYYPPLTAAQRDDLLGWLVCGAPDD